MNILYIITEGVELALLVVIVLVIVITLKDL
jgi:hypothetical protein